VGVASSRVHSLGSRPALGGSRVHKEAGTLDNPWPREGMVAGSRVGTGEEVVDTREGKLGEGVGKKAGTLPSSWLLSRHQQGTHGSVDSAMSLQDGVQVPP
jgi:hypothetical protein